MSIDWGDFPPEDGEIEPSILEVTRVSAEGVTPFPRSQPPPRPERVAPATEGVARGRRALTRTDAPRRSRALRAL